jgi:hypothetical protein
MHFFKALSPNTSLALANSIRRHAYKKHPSTFVPFQIFGTSASEGFGSAALPGSAEKGRVMTLR